MSYVVLNCVGILIGVFIGVELERRAIAANLRARAIGLTIQAAVELKTIADEICGK